MTTIIDGTSGISTPMYNGSITANPVTPSVNMKNRIINGAMVIDQRNAGAAVTTDGAFPVDRFFCQITYGSLSLQQNTTAPVGFNYSTKVTVSTGGTASANDRNSYRQNIEGYNVADLNFGSANAKTITLSFWVQSSLTGTFSGALQNSAQNRSYIFSYSISSANTWEQKTITIAGDTTGTWLTTNGIGLSVWFDLGTGTNRQTTAGSWVAGDYRSATGSVALTNNNAAVWYVSGVQLEVGSTASSFDYRPYGTELALCQRYYQTIGGDIASQFAGTGMNYANNASNIYIPLLVKMRTTPSIGYSSVSDWGITYGAGSQAVSIGIATDQSSTVSANISVTVSGTPLTVGGAAKLIAQATTAARLNFSSEL